LRRHPRLPLGLLAGVLCLAWPVAAAAQFVATQIDASNANSLLFGGTDADGGVTDWYVSNGVIEAIIDDAALRTDLPGGAPQPPKQSEAGFSGGTLLDLGLVGHDNDQLPHMFTVGGLSTSNFVVHGPSPDCPTCSISASTTANSATIRVEGVLLGFGPTSPPSDLRLVTEYIAEGSNPYLTIRTTLDNNGTGTPAGLGGFLDVLLWTSRGITPFSPLPGKGFTHTALDLTNPAAALELPTYAAGPGNVGPADGVNDPNTGAVSGEVSYGLLGESVSLDPDGPTGPTPPTVTPVNTMFGVSSDLITAMGNLPAGALGPGAELVYTRRIYVGDRNDVASVANNIFTDLAARTGFATGTISGDVDAAETPAVEASVIATRTDAGVIPGFATGAPTTQFRTNPADGTFSGIVLPVGTYDLEFRAEERDPVTVTGVVVTAGADTVVSVPTLSGKGMLHFEVRESVKGPDPLVPAKVTFKGLDVPDPRFKRDFEAFSITPTGPEDIEPETFGGGLAHQNMLYLPNGTGSVQLRPGRYELYISRGPEYSVRRRRVRVREGRDRRVRTRIRRIAPVTDALSADFHIHSARSLDSSAGVMDRVASFAGEGLEVMVSTDHDFIVDYAPIIASLGLGNLMTSMVGSETTTSVPNPPAFPDSIGHINSWPLSLDPIARRDGAIEDEFTAPNHVFSLLRARGAQVVQYNHPRSGVSGLTSIGFFNNFGYDPTLPITAPPNDLLLDDDVLGPGISGVPNPDGFRNIDFDVMEIMNGTNLNRFSEVRSDWFSLLNQLGTPTANGPVPFIGGTAVSDSHRIQVEAPAYGRTYVLGVGDSPQGVDTNLLNSKVRAGHMFGTTGPFIDFSVDDGSASAGIGDTLVPAGASVNLHIRVRATNWMPVQEVRLVANGFTVMKFTGSQLKSPPRSPWSQGKGRVTRLDTTVTLPVSQDTYFLVEAGAPVDGTPVLPANFARMIVPGLEPMAFTNPIFVDLAGDGFDAPGLPVEQFAGGGAGAGAAAGRSLSAVMSSLSPDKKAEVLHHFPIYKLSIPESAVQSLAP